MPKRSLTVPRTLFSAMLMATGVGLLVPALLIGGLWMGWFEPRLAKQAQQAELDLKLDLLAGSLPDVLWNLEQVPASQIVGTVMRAPEVSRVQVYDNSQQANFIDVQRATPADVPQAESPAGPPLHGRRAVVRNGVAIGWVEVVMTGERAVADLRRQRLVYQATVAAQLLLSLLLVLVLLHVRVSRPLHALGRFANALARGDFKAPLAPAGGDEISALAGHLAGMREALAAQFVAQQALLNRLRGVAETVPGVLFQLHVDAQGGQQFAYVSEAARSCFGLSPEALLADAQAWWHVVHPHDRPRLRAALQASARDGQAWREEFRIGAPDTALGQRWLLLHAVVRGQADGSATWTGIQSDISRQRQDAAELDAHRHHLEALVLARTQALAAATDAAEVASRAKTAFLRNMSHEMRTPLNGIIGMTALLQRQPLDTRQRRQLALVAQSADHLLGTINHVLDLARIEAGKLALVPEAFTADALLAELKALLAPQAQAKQLPLQMVMAPGLAGQWLMADRQRISEALLNLAGNALKFTEQGQVCLQASLVRADRGMASLRIEVQDSGIGIDAETQGRLFRDFEQADASITRRYGGSGLGLAISRRLVELMGGSIGLRSQPGQGSTFWLEVPVQLMAAPAALQLPALDGTDVQADPFAPLRCYAGTRVLLAEDDPVNQQVMVAMLECAGLVVDVAADGAQAVAMARGARHALVLMDMQMPVMDGLEATRRLRHGPPPLRMPIIAITANAFADERQLCLDAGMDDHIAKPVMVTAVCRTLAHWLGRAWATDAHVIDSANRV